VEFRVSIINIFLLFDTARSLVIPTMTERLTRSSVVGLQMQQKSFSSVPTMARLSWILVVCIVLIQVSLGEDATVFQTTTTVSDGTTTTTTTTTKTKKLDLAEDAPTETTKTEEVQSAIPLTARDFGSSVGDGNRWLLEFYSPHCGHCEAFAPTYSAIAKAYHGSSDHNHNIKVAKIDGSSETALSSRFGVYAYPSFYLVDGWSVYA
jgi:thiol-disulfide isomerase/thioredoxin